MVEAASRFVLDPAGTRGQGVEGSNPFCSTIQSLGFGHRGESVEIRTYARDLRSRMDPENTVGGANSRNLAKPYLSAILMGPRSSP